MDCERMLRTAGLIRGIQPEAGVRWNVRPTMVEPPKLKEPRGGLLLLRIPSPFLITVP